MVGTKDTVKDKKKVVRSANVLSEPSLSSRISPARFTSLGMGFLKGSLVLIMYVHNASQIVPYNIANALGGLATPPVICNGALVSRNVHFF
jgi:hypothetical protein